MSGSPLDNVNSVVFQLRWAVADVPSVNSSTVRSADEMAASAETCGGRLIVPPFDIEGIARIALIVDSIGAPLGLWQRPKGSPGEEEDEHV